MNEKRYCVKCFKPVDEYGVKISNDANEALYHQGCFAVLKRNKGLPILALNEEEQVELIEKVKQDDTLSNLITKILNHDNE